MENMKQWIKNLPSWQKIAVGGVLFLILGASSFWYAMPDGYQTLYEGLSEEERKDVQVELSHMGVDYRVSEGGSVQIQGEEIAWVRRELQEQGLPTSSDGFSLYLESNLGETSQDRENRRLVGLKQQLEQDLVRDYSVINSATVHLTLAEDDNIFSQEPSRGDASVTIGTARNQDLTRSQIQGIQSNIAAAVSGVEADDVIVADRDTGLISLEDEENGASSSYEKQLEITHMSERQKYEDIERTLTSLFGRDNFEVNVDMQINFDEIVRNIEEFADEGVLRSHQSEGEESLTIDGAELDEVGVDENGDVVGYDIDTEEGSTLHQEQKDKLIENFEVGKTVESVVEHPEIANTNIAITINEQSLEERDMNMVEFEDYVGVAAGLTTDEDGGFENGEVSIFPFDFVEEEIVEEEEIIEEEEEPGMLEAIPLWFWIVFGSVTLGIGLFLFFFIRKKRREKKILIEELRRQEEALKQQQEQSKNNVQEVELEEPDGRTSLKLKGEEHEQQANKIAEQYPKQTAQYLRKLLDSRW